MKTLTEKEEQTKRLKEWMPKGSTVYTILRHVSKSGMTRDISLVVFQEGAKYPIHPNWSASKVLNWRMSNKSGMNDSIRVSGCGMDMGFHLVYTLSSILYGDGYALKQEWL